MGNQNVKLEFDGSLGYQQEAVNSIADIFKGQKTKQSIFTVQPLPEELLFGGASQGYSNSLNLLLEDIQKDVHEIQLRNGLKQSDLNTVKTMNFSIWMETGTGKTYVYLRTIFELNRRYGWTKFIIVVPSIAIREGVNSSIEQMRDHLEAQYGNVPFNYFIYNSSRLNQVRDFAQSSNIRIMIMNIGAFNKKENIIYDDNDRMMGSPIAFISQTRPVVIIDEPQSVANTENAQRALSNLKALCTFRYSATHRKGQHYCMMYKLDSVDAYEQKLVKQIEVAGLQIDNEHNTPYVKLLSTANKGGTITAKLELDISKKGSVSRSSCTVKLGDTLLKKSGNLDKYEGYKVSNISCEPGNEWIQFQNNKELLLGQNFDCGLSDALKKEQIRKTIEEHLNKAKRLKPKGIKVLSLFFIDKVSNYRAYDEHGIAQKGKFAQWFEEAFKSLAQEDRYKELFPDGTDFDRLATQVHDGYFSIDGKGKQVDTPEDRANREQQACDERGYQLIMKNKTLLLSFASPVQFIFSHSALKEGWDNPNVFQICTLNEISSDMRRRQMIGRGLRICVNQEGKRVPGFDVNTLTVMANESFKDFAENLQHEIEEEEGFKFGKVEEHTFASILVTNEEGEQEYLGEEKSKCIYNDLKTKGLIHDNGTVTDGLKTAVKDGTITYPDDVKEHSALITAVLRKICGNLNIKNKEQARTVNLKKERFLSPEFEELWNKIKYKTTYRVNFETEKLIAKCVEQIKDKSILVVSAPRYVYTRADVQIDQGGVRTAHETEQTQIVRNSVFAIPDIIRALQNETLLTRKTIAQILSKSERLEDLRKNPQMFIDGAVKIIKSVLDSFLVDGITYHKLGDEDIWAQELFNSEMVQGYLEHNMLETPNHGLYEYTVYDSDIERDFAQKLEQCGDVKLFVKLPAWFKIPTPLGTYNPDWALLVEKQGEKKLYFVVETKGKNDIDSMTPKEKSKIQCGQKHFHAIAKGVVDFVAPVSSFNRLQDIIDGK